MEVALYSYLLLWVLIKARIVIKKWPVLLADHQLGQLIWIVFEVSESPCQSSGCEAHSTLIFDFADFHSVIT
jgi:hypothetical protein